MQYTIRKKDYIQPFETELAKMELFSIVGEENVKALNELEFQLETTEEVCTLLIQKLTYWERITGDISRDIYQATLESTASTSSDKHRDQTNSQQFFDIKSGTFDKKIGRNIGSELPRRRILRYGPHDLHEYRGKFFPQLVRSLINISEIKPESLILDPFCGSGTTACESLIQGMNVIGLDLNPLSAEITVSKCLSITDETLNLNEYQNKSGLFTKKSDHSNYPWNQKDVEYLGRWFTPEALDDISDILWDIDNIYEGTSRRLATIALSNILRTISKQKDVDLRVHKDDSKVYREGQALDLFKEQIQKQTIKLIPYCKMTRELPKGNFKIEQGDTRDVCKIYKGYLGECNLLITSPPYATALPYLDTDRLSLVVLGMMHRSDFPSKNLQMIGNREISEKQRIDYWEYYLSRKEDLTQEINDLIKFLAENNHGAGIGFRRRNLPTLLAKYFLDMHDSMEASFQMMEHGSKAYYVVGNNRTHIGDREILIDTNKLLWDLGARVGWTKEREISMELLQSRDIFKENCGTAESILMFKKD